MRLTSHALTLVTLAAGCTGAATQGRFVDPPGTNGGPATGTEPAEPVSGDVAISAAPCSRRPVPFARGMGTLAHDAHWMYGFGGDRIVRVGIEGGAPETVVDAAIPTEAVGTHQAWGLLVDDEALYWTTYELAAGGNIFWRAPKRGGVAAEVARGFHSSAPFAQRLLMFGNELFYAADGPIVAAVPTRGGSPRMVAQPLHLGGDVVAVDDANVYWLTVDSSLRTDLHYLETAPRRGGAARVLAQWTDASHSQPHIFADDAFLYDVDYAMVRSVDKRDGTVRVLWGGDGAPPIASGSYRGAALADGQVYWASYYQDWIFSGMPTEYISRVGTDGSAPTALTSSPDTPISDGMVAWGDSLYLHVGKDVLRMCR